MKTTKKIFKIMSFLVLSVLMLTLSVFGSGAVAEIWDKTAWDNYNSVDNMDINALSAIMSDKYGI